MKKHFLIASFSGSFAPSPRLTSRDPRIAPPFLFNTNKAHRIIIPISVLMKTKEKKFSIQYKSALLTNRRRRRSPRPRFPLRAGLVYSAGPMLDLGYVREHLDVIEKMARDRGLALDLAPFRQLDTDRRTVITSAERPEGRAQQGQRRNRAHEEVRRGCFVPAGPDEAGLRPNQARSTKPSPCSTSS